MNQTVVIIIAIWIVVMAIVISGKLKPPRGGTKGAFGGGLKW